jgi:hypothetical protein
MPSVCELLIPLTRFGHDRQIALFEQLVELLPRGFQIALQLPRSLF